MKCPGRVDPAARRENDARLTWLSREARAPLLDSFAPAVSARRQRPQTAPAAAALAAGPGWRSVVAADLEVAAIADPGAADPVPAGAVADPAAVPEEEVVDPEALVPEVAAVVPAEAGLGVEAAAAPEAVGIAAISKSY